MEPSGAFPVRCDGCGAHFSLSPGDMSGALACPECGGDRFFRNQPSPTQSDGALRDMVDPISQKDQGGNPLGEGFAGFGGAEKPELNRDNFMHAKIATGDEEGYQGWPNWDSWHAKLMADNEEQHQRALNGMMESGQGHPEALRDYYMQHIVGPHNEQQQAEADEWNNMPLEQRQSEYPHAQDYENYDPQMIMDPEAIDWQRIHQNHLSDFPPAIHNLYKPLTNPQHPDPWMDSEPGSMTFPQEWTSSVTQLEMRTANTDPYPELWSDDWMREAFIKMAPGAITPEQAANQQAALQGKPLPYQDSIGSALTQDLLPLVGEFAPAATELFGGGAAGASAGEVASGGIGNAARGIAGDVANAGMKAVRRFGPGMVLRDLLPGHGGTTPGVSAPAVDKATPLIGLGKTAGPLMALIPEGLDLAGMGGAAAGGAMGGGGVAGMIGKGIGKLMKGVFGGGGSPGISAPSQAAPMAALGSIPALLAADLETPSSVRSVGEQHDDPEQQDQKEFNVGDKSPKNMENPNNQDSGANGEDNVRSDAGFGQDSPGIERLMMVLPLVLHYFQSEESGENDPIMRALHETLEQENPGYMTQEDHPDSDAIIQMLLDQHHKPQGIHAGGVNPLQQMMPGGTMPGGLPSTPQPNSPVANPPGSAQQNQGTCPSCGGPMTNGTCPSCAMGQSGWGSGGAGGGQAPMGGGLPTPGGMQNYGGVSVQQSQGMGQSMQGTGMGGGTCPVDGTPLAADGTCPHCGMKGGQEGYGLQQPHSAPSPSMGGGTVPFDGDQVIRTSGMGMPPGMDPSQMGGQPMDPSQMGAGAPPGMPPPGMMPPPGPPPGQAPNSQMTPELKAALIQYLIKHNRIAEVPDVELHPENFRKEVAELQHQPQTLAPLPPDPTQQTPPGGQMDPSGAMPVMDPTQPGGGGGGGMQAMGHHLAYGSPGGYGSYPIEGTPWCSMCNGLGRIYQRQGENAGIPWERNENNEPPVCPQCNGSSLQPEPDLGMMPETQHPLGPSFGRVAADNFAPRCPECGSATTGIRDGIDSFSGGDTGHKGAHCHSCGHDWNPSDQLGDRNKSASILIALVNPLLENAADQTSRQDRTQDSSLTFQDNLGQQLKQGGIYEMHTPGIEIPDMVKVIYAKPDELGLKLVGQFNNIPNSINGQPETPDFKLSPIDVQERRYSFIQADATKGQSIDGTQPTPLGGMPGLDQIPQSGQTTDEVSNSYPNQGTVSHYERDDEVCPRCHYTHIYHQMTSPDTTFHQCVKCASAWETKDEFQGREASVDLSWLNDGPSDDFFGEMERARSMASFSSSSRNIGDIAAKDERLQMVHSMLESNKTARAEHQSGRHYTPSEMRELIDEHGHARNMNLLDLSGTHYEVRPDFTGKSNADNVPLDHMMMGF